MKHPYLNPIEQLCGRSHRPPAIFSLSEKDDSPCQEKITKGEGGHGETVTDEAGWAGGPVCRPYGPHPPCCAWRLPLRGRHGRVMDPPLRRYPPSHISSETQARKLNRTSGNFCTPRAQWPGGNRGKPLKFCAPEGYCPPKGVTLVNGVRGRLPLSGGDGPKGQRG